MPKRSKPPTASTTPKSEFVCKFCQQNFVRETTLATHLCEKKKRNLEKDEKHVRMATRVYSRFFELTTSAKRPRTFDDLANSRVYGDFIKIGKYIIDINPVNTPAFVDFLIKSGMAIRDWTNPIVYETYLRELTKKETPDAAVTRNILLMQQWASDTGADWSDFFREVSPNQAAMWIKTGRISPWMIYIASSSAEMLSRFTDEQIAMVSSYLDPNFWSVMLKRHSDEVDYFRSILDEAGV